MTAIKSPAPRARAALTALAAALALSGCEDRPASRRPATGSTPQALGAAAAADIEACVDAFLAARGLDRFGHPEGTLYAGGTPLFDERTGETRDRPTYVFARHPAARDACARDAGRGPGPGR